MRRVAAIVTLLAAPAVAWAGSYRWPTTFAAPVTAGFDNNDGSGSPLDWECGGNSYSGHRGTDIGIVKFTNVYAGAGGYVKHSTDGFGDGFLGSTDGGGFGNAVAIFHGAGDETIYGHLSAGTGIPAVGTTIACADLIGQSGTSGNSTGPHLHFETRVGVVETGSYYSGSADDPYAGPCSGPLSYWTDQGGGTPTTDCFVTPPVDMCNGLTVECVGDLLRRCVDLAIVERDCAAEGLVCAGNDCVPGSVDGDGDGSPAGVDCDDADPDVHPGASEACDGVDRDCSGAAGDGVVRSCCETGMQSCTGVAWTACSVVCEGGDPDGTVDGGCAVGGRGGRGGALLVLVLAFSLRARRRARG